MVHEFFDPNEIDYDPYFSFGQIGSGSIYYEGIPFQRGYGDFYGEGMGTIFRNLIRVFKSAAPVVKSAAKSVAKGAAPILKSAGKAAGEEALEATSAILHNIAQGEKLKDAVKTETKKGVKRLASRLTQSGGGPAAKRRRVGSRKRSKKKPKRKVKKRRIGKKRKRAPNIFNTKTKLGFY